MGEERDGRKNEQKHRRNLIEYAKGQERKKEGRK